MRYSYRSAVMGSTHRAPRGNVTREQSYASEYHGDREESKGVGGVNHEELALEKTAKSERGGNSDPHAGENNKQDFAQHQSHDAAWRCAESQADSDFARAPRSLVTEDSIHSDGCEHEREAGKNSHEDHQETLLGDGAGPNIAHSLNTGHRLLGVNGGDDFADFGADVHGPGGADEQGRSEPEIRHCVQRIENLRLRHVHGGSGRPAHAHLFYIGYDADNLARLVLLGRDFTGEQSSADGILARPH